MNRLCIACLFLVLVAWGLPQAAAQDDNPWKSWDEAYALARQHDRNVFYFIFSTKCSSCKKVFTEHFARPEISSLVLNYYVPVLAEVDLEKDVIVHYKGQSLTQDSLQKKLLELANFTEPGYKLPLLFVVEPRDAGDDRVVYAHGYLELNDLMAFIDKNRRGTR